MAMYDLANFTNIDQEKFIGQWAGEDYPLEPGQTGAFPVFLVDHFCKHLADKILMRTDEYGNDEKRAALYAQMKSGSVISAQPPEKPKTEGEILKEQIEKQQAELALKEKTKQEEIKAKRIEALKKARAARGTKKAIA